MDSVDRAVLLRPLHPDSYGYSQQDLVVGGSALLEQRLDQATGGQWELAVEWDEPQVRTPQGKKPYIVHACSVVLTLPGLPPKPGYGSADQFAVHQIHNSRKTALSYAIRSAANRFGVGRELWPDVAGEHWLYWISLLTTEAQLAEACELLDATAAWLKSSQASSDHRDAWRFHMPRVRRALMTRIGGDLPEPEARPELSEAKPRRDPDDEFATDPDDEFTRDDDDPFDDPDTFADGEGPKSDHKLLAKFMAQLGAVLETADYDAAKKLRLDTMKAYKAARHETGGPDRIRIGGEADKALTKKLAETLEYLRGIDTVDAAPSDLKE